MKRGVLGLMRQDLPPLQSHRETRTVDGVELRDQISVAGVQRTANGTDITEGRAATQSLGEQESVQLTADDVVVDGTDDVRTRHTQFASVPGEFVVVENAAGTFLFDLIESQTGGAVERATLDLDAFLDALPDPQLWKVGFYDRDGGAESGVVHGDDVLDDGAFGAALESLPKNQIGVDTAFDGTEYKLDVARSGYVEVYRPSDVDTAEYVEFLREVVVPHAQ